MHESKYVIVVSCHHTYEVLKYLIATELYLVSPYYHGFLSISLATLMASHLIINVMSTAMLHVDCHPSTHKQKCMKASVCDMFLFSGCYVAIQSSHSIKTN